jgi:two-component system response regulator PilR (NtrC family)
VNEMVARVAPAKTTVLITGESGTGKEMFARSIHAQSDRAARAFIPINCGAIPESLIESELFGHTKGAFTGATGDKKGLFSAAEGGTIFLDEIGELPLAMQVKLLRVLQERKIKRVGSATEETVDARVVAATNRDLRDMVKAGTFREDLFYRLNVIELHLPPLRERRDDIPLLIHHFIAKYAVELGKTIRGVEKDAMQCLLGHPYQGNVRELENIVERAVTLELTELITRDSLPHGMQEAVRSIEIGGSLEVTEEGVDLEAIVEQLERTLIAKALKRASGVRTEAAGLLKISFRSLRYRLQKYGIDGGDIDDPS